MTLNLNAPFILATSALAALLVYRQYTDSKPRAPPIEDRTFNRGLDYPATIRTISPEVFEVRTDWGPWGLNEDAAPKHLLLSKEKCEAYLKKLSKSTKKAPGKGKVIWGWDEAALNVNIPDEDGKTIDVVSKSALRGLLPGQGEGGEGSFWERWAMVKDKGQEEKGGEMGEMMLFSVFDGHGKNGSVAKLLERVLHPCLLHALAEVDAGQDGRSLEDDGAVKQAMVDAFVRLDKEILQATQNVLETTEIRDKMRNHNSVVSASLLPLENAGSCAVTLLVDTQRGKLYVANLGDCRAVAGWFNPITGTWRCDVLSEDHAVDNPAEQAYIRAKHPNEPGVIAIPEKLSRLLGYFTLSRSFGDAIAKRSLGTAKRMRDQLGIAYPNGRDGFDDGPYMRSDPDVIVRDIRQGLSEGEELKFVILASDGLWGEMSSEEACLLVAARLSGISQTISKNELAADFPLQLTEPRPYPKEDLPGTTPHTSQGSWTFQDDNLATHLLRNALGRGDEWLRERLISMKDNGARLFRDDTTVIVVRFG